MKQLWVLISVFLLVGAADPLALTWAAPATAGSVVSVTGQVSIRRTAAEQQPPVPARAGLAVFVGDTVITGADSSAKVMALDQSILDLGPSTSFRIEEMNGADENRQATGAVDFGQVRAS